MKNLTSLPRAGSYGKADSRDEHQTRDCLHLISPYTPCEPECHRELGRLTKLRLHRLLTQLEGHTPPSLGIRDWEAEPLNRASELMGCNARVALRRVEVLVAE